VIITFSKAALLQHLKNSFCDFGAASAALARCQGERYRARHRRDEVVW